MNKKNTQPLIISPLVNPQKIYADGDDMRPATNEPTDQPQNPQDVLNQGAAQIGQGIKNGTLADVRTGTAIVTGVANVLHGADPMRPAKAHPTNGDSLPGAYDEFNRYQSILRTEHPGVFRRIDLTRLGSDMTALEEARALYRMYQGRLGEADKLVRFYENEAAPTLVSIYNECRPTINQHADLQDNMPNLTKLAVGAQQDALASKNNNDRVREKAKNDKGVEPPAVPSVPQQTTTTVTTPAPTATAPATPPAATPAASHHRTHTTHTAPSPKGWPLERVRKRTYRDRYLSDVLIKPMPVQFLMRSRHLGPQVILPLEVCILAALSGILRDGSDPLRSRARFGDVSFR